MVLKEKEQKKNNLSGAALISLLKEIKEKVTMGDYNQVIDLKEDMKLLEESTWGNIKDLSQDNLSALSLYHSFLIEEVIKIHQREESSLNNVLIKENSNVKKIISSVEDGKLSSRIYFFKDENFENYYVGDLHSDDFVLDCILSKADFLNKVINNHKIRIVFLGDYVDRGKAHLKTMEKIMILKYIFPGNIFQLMGNHDGGNIEKDVVSLCVRKPEEDATEDYFILYLDELTKINNTYSRILIEKYLELFNTMGLVSFLSCHGEIFCGVHGGIPRPFREEQESFGYISTIRDLTDELKVNNKGETIISNILWSDPLEGTEDKYEHTRRFGFKEEEFYLYSEQIGIDYLIRGHEAFEEGFKYFFKERVCCIFGSGAVYKEGKNINSVTAYPWVNPVILKVDKTNGKNIIRLNE